MDDHEDKEGRMMEQPVELLADAGSVEARGELSFLPPRFGAELSASLQALNKHASLGNLPIAMGKI